MRTELVAAVEHLNGVAGVVAEEERAVTHREVEELDALDRPLPGVARRLDVDREGLDVPRVVGGA
jgi:hypothetical protein